MRHFCTAKTVANQDFKKFLVKFSALELAKKSS